MKRLIYIILFLPFILISCDKTPESLFSADLTEPEVGQSVLFNNNSHHGERFEWDFGDGYTSNERNPVHVFLATGSFEVTLTAFSKGGLSDKSSLMITVLVPTLLQIEVREYFSNDLIPGASIILYPSISDWDAQTNSVMEAFTDADGVAVFANLDPFVYYVDVWEATHDNYTLRTEDVGFVTTPGVLTHKITSFIAYVDIADHPNGMAGSGRNMIIKKLERKSIDKKQPAAKYGTGNWQELYNRIQKK